MDYNKIHEHIVEWIKNSWFGTNENIPVVIGISGGKDSTVCAALLAEALGANRVIGVMMPNGIQKDIDDSQKVVDFLKIRSMTVNIGEAYKALSNAIDINFCEEDVETNTQDKPLYTTNTPARLRMTTLYGIAAMFGGVVCNTCNLSEDWIGYSTKWGDAVGDFSLLNCLTKSEVVALGDTIGLPYELIHKVPSDGMCGKTDEDNLGFSYDELDAYIRSQPKYNINSEYDSNPNLLSGVVEKIEKMHFAPNTKKKCIELDNPFDYSSTWHLPTAF